MPWQVGPRFRRPPACWRFPSPAPSQPLCRRPPPRNRILVGRQLAGALSSPAGQPARVRFTSPRCPPLALRKIDALPSRSGGFPTADVPARPPRPVRRPGRVRRSSLTALPARPSGGTSGADALEIARERPHAAQTRRRHGARRKPGVPQWKWRCLWPRAPPGKRAGFLAPGAQQFDLHAQSADPAVGFV